MMRKTKAPIASKRIPKLQQDIVAVFVFAFGFALIIAVLWLGYIQFFAPSQNVPLPKSAEKMQTNIQKIQKNDMNLQGADVQIMQGLWVSEYNDRRVFFSLNGKNFQTSLWDDPMGKNRRISAGQIIYYPDLGVVTLKNSSNYKLPKIKGSKVSVMTTSTYNIIPLYSEREQSLYWVPYKSEQHKRSEVHPLFNYVQRSDSFIRFMRYKKPRP